MSLFAALQGWYPPDLAWLDEVPSLVPVCAEHLPLVHARRDKRALALDGLPFRCRAEYESGRLFSVHFAARPVAYTNVIFLVPPGKTVALGPVGYKAEGKETNALLVLQLPGPDPECRRMVTISADDRGTERVELLDVLYQDPARAKRRRLRFAGVRLYADGRASSLADFDGSDPSFGPRLRTVLEADYLLDGETLADDDAACPEAAEGRAMNLLEECARISIALDGLRRSLARRGLDREPAVALKKGETFLGRP